MLPVRKEGKRKNARSHVRPHAHTHTPANTHTKLLFHTRQGAHTTVWYTALMYNIGLYKTFMVTIVYECYIVMAVSSYTNHCSLEVNIIYISIPVRNHHVYKTSSGGQQRT